MSTSKIALVDGSILVTDDGITRETFGAVVHMTDDLTSAPIELTYPWHQVLWVQKVGDPE